MISRNASTCGELTMRWQFGCIKLASGADGTYSSNDSNDKLDADEDPRTWVDEEFGAGYAAAMAQNGHDCGYGSKIKLSFWDDSDMVDEFRGCKL
jgi:hypothetical protein